MKSVLAAVSIILVGGCEIVDPRAVDGGPGDAGLADGGIDDAGIGDAGIGDAGGSDAGLGDAGVDAGALLPVVQFTDTYLSESWGACRSSAGMVGYEPTTTGVKYPLFIYIVGTLDNWGYSSSYVYNPAQPNPVVLSILKDAAARGLVAVSPEYDNFFLVSCGGLRAKTRCVYDPSDANSVVAKLCARPNVDCDLGIITAGHSQGAQLTSYARNWNSRVRAVWGLGATSDFVGGFGPGDQPGISNPTGTADDRCIRDDMTAIASDRHRLVNGLNEMCFPTSVPPYDATLPNPSANCGMASSQGELQRMTGTSCPSGVMSCLNANGSGWLVVPNEAVQGGSADHTWFGVKADGGPAVPEAGFAVPATNPWSLSVNIDWLKGFTGPGNAVPVRIDSGATAASDGPFSKDDLFAGTGVNSTAAAIDVSAPNAAPAGVYQSYRFAGTGAVVYDLPGLAPNSPFTVRLHFAEVHHASAGARRFHVDVQGLRKETNLDVFAEAGGMNRALVKSYAAVSDATGRITVTLSRGAASTPMVSGLEVL